MFLSRDCTESPQSWTAFAPAKLNLFLEILGKRDDGFHELDTLMVPVRLFDTLSWSPAAEHEAESFRFHMAPAGSDIPTDDSNLLGSNLVIQAAELLAREAGITPCGTFTLTKRIPIQAGMGGGSSDAAAALALANRAWGVNYPHQRLASLAARLGSDIPFFFAGGPAICQGRGQRTSPVTGLPKLHFVVVKPPVAVSTREAFATLQAPAYQELPTGKATLHAQRLVELLRTKNLCLATYAMRNSFERVICNLKPRLQELLDLLRRINPWGGMMTGSGSAFFSLCRSANHANHVAGRLRSYLDWKPWNESGMNRCIDRSVHAQGTVSETALGGAHDRIHGTVWTTSTCH